MNVDPAALIASDSDNKRKLPKKKFFQMETEEPSHRANSNTKFIVSSQLVFNYLADVTLSGHLGVHDAALWNQAVADFKKWRIQELNSFRFSATLNWNSVPPFM